MRCGPEILDELEFPTGGAGHRVGVRRVPKEQWLQPVDPKDPTLRAKRRLAQLVPDEVFVALPGTETAGQVAAQAVGVVGAGGDDDRHPLALAAEQVAEDLCVVSPDPRGLLLVAASVSFPSRWRPRDKLGLPMEGVHGPVPDDGQDLAGRINRFMTRLAPGDIWVRTNWFVHDRPVRCALAVPRHDRVITSSAEVPRRLWLRSERQGLTRLEDDNILFTIFTRFAPVAVLAERPAAAAALLAHLRWLDPALAPDKVTPAHQPALCAWLEQVSADSELLPSADE